MRHAAITIALCAVLLLGAAVARGELVQRGDLRVSFSGRITPHALPRDQAVPVRVRLNGSVATADGRRPPQLRRISIAVNRYGRISTRGLPTCGRGELETTSSRVALGRCRGALIGRGRFGANVELPSLTPFPVEGRILAFNGRVRRRPVIYLHVHGSNPVEATVVLTFRIAHPKRGRYGTVLTTTIPKIAGDLGYATDVTLNFGRTYRHAGRRRSFISARCAAPPGFPGAIFAFARGSFSFANGKTLTTTLARDCVVR